MQINTKAIDNGKGQPIYKQTAYELDVQDYELPTPTGTVKVKVDTAVREKLQEAGRTFCQKGGGRYLQVSTSQEERKRWGIAGKPGSPCLHQAVIAWATGLLPDVPVDHINERSDNRFNSLRLVTDGINTANGGGPIKGDNPGVCFRRSRGDKYCVNLMIDGVRPHLFQHKDKATANQASQVVLHYRSALHAERSNLLMGRHAARCFTADVETPMLKNWTNSWHRLTTAALALEHYYLCGNFEAFPATPTVPVKELKALCCAVADGMDVTAAIAKAKAMAVKNERMVLLALIDAAATAA